MSNEMKMGSKEIAQITVKLHGNVKRAIKALASKGIVNFSQIDKKSGGRGRTTEEYFVGERDSYVIVAQLSPQFTAILVDRWRALESGEAKPLGHIPGFDELRAQFEALQEENDQLKQDVKDNEWLTCREADAVYDWGLTSDQKGDVARAASKLAAKDRRDVMWKKVGKYHSPMMPVRYFRRAAEDLSFI